MARLGEPRFNRYGQYEVIPQGGDKPVPHTRVTTLVKTVDDGYGLGLWKLRQVAKGLSARADLLAGVAACRDDDKAKLDELCETALEASGSSKGATLGEALHKFAERLDKGEELEVPKDWAPDIDAYRAMMAEEGIEHELIEVTVVLAEMAVAGTADRVIRYRGHLYIADIKTGQSLDYSWPAMAAQLACYAHAPTRYDWRRALPDARGRLQKPRFYHLGAGRAGTVRTDPGRPRCGLAGRPIGLSGPSVPQVGVPARCGAGPSRSTGESGLYGG